MNDPGILSYILVISAVTVFLRALPFLIFRNSRPVPAFILYLGKVLPCAIMAMLVVYCLRNVTFSATSGYIPPLIGTISVILLHLWKRNTLLSIVGGTVIYMLLVQLVF